MGSHIWSKFASHFADRSSHSITVSLYSGDIDNSSRHRKLVQRLSHELGAERFFGRNWMRTHFAEAVSRYPGWVLGVLSLVFGVRRLEWFKRGEGREI